MSDMNTASWEVDDAAADEIHRDSRHDEFFGWCLGYMREYRRLFPDREPGVDLLEVVTTIMRCQKNLPDSLAYLPTYTTVEDMVSEWGWATTVSLIGAAMRELEREVA